MKFKFFCDMKLCYFLKLGSILETSKKKELAK